MDIIPKVRGENKEYLKPPSRQLYILKWNLQITHLERKWPSKPPRCFWCFRFFVSSRSQVSGNSQGESALMGDSEPCSLPRGLGNGMLRVGSVGFQLPHAETRKWKFAAYNHLNIPPTPWGVWTYRESPSSPAPWCDRTYRESPSSPEKTNMWNCTSVKLDFTSSFTCPAFSNLLTVKTSTCISIYSISPGKNNKTRPNSLDQPTQSWQTSLIWMVQARWAQRGKKLQKILCNRG